MIIVVSNPLDEMTTLAQIASGFPHQRVIGQAGHARHRAVHLLRRREARRPGRRGEDADPRLARRHDGPGAERLHGQRAAARRPPRRRDDRGARRPDPQRRGRGRRAAQERVGVLRAVRRGRPDGEGRRGGLRRRHAGLRVARPASSASATSTSASRPSSARAAFARSSSATSPRPSSPASRRPPPLSGRRPRTSRRSEAPTPLPHLLRHPLRTRIRLDGARPRLAAVPEPRQTVVRPRV